MLFACLSCLIISSLALQLRNENEVGAMGKGNLVQAKIRGCFKKILRCLHLKHQKGSGANPDVEDPAARKQYRLEPGRKKRTSWWRCGSKRTPYNVGMVVSRNQMSLAMYLHWMFRVNFLFLFALSCVVFFALTIFFSGFIILAGKMEPKCVRVGGEEFESSGAAFADAFALSWTTFSTVGYGSTYPALGHENDSPTNCLFITIICSLESFCGVLYSGICGAILFGKVLRIQSHAQVIFSDPIAIRYGSGVESHLDGDDDEYTDAGKRKIPCPVLEFRIVNRLFDDQGGEIIDATLNVVASIDADDADCSPTFDKSDHGSSIASTRLDSDMQGSLHSYDATQDHSSRTNELSTSSIRFVDKLLRKSHQVQSQVIDEDPVSRIVNKRIFSKMTMEASDHPFFKRVWLARHVLDESSPLLTNRTRRAIKKCGGFWPENLNNYKGVQESLAFNQILVSLNGVSNVSASDVYAQKIYDHVDVNVGYEFVNLLYRDGDMLKVDTDLINDVKEQNGGGGEPLTFAATEQ